MPYTQLIFPSGQRRRDRLTRVLRALWRDTSALWREFRVSFMTFLLVIFGGGYLYGLLNTLAGNPPIPLISLPYVMIALMVLETPVPTPTQPYLIVFWYVLPLTAAYILGRGAVDFVRLFFDRSGRRNAWEEAVASTYRNHVIVLGIGHVGLRVARALVAMGFEVVGIDTVFKADVDAELSALAVPTIIADGRLSSTLDKAGLRSARALIVCTADDFVNLEIVMRARDMQPDIRIVVRMWDNQFAKQLNRFMGVEAVLSASDLAAPAFAGAAVGIEITQSLTIHGVEYSMIKLQVVAGSFMDGTTVGDLQADNEIDIVLHERGGEVDVHPRHDIAVQAGDTVVIFARHSRILEIVTRKRGK